MTMHLSPAKSENRPIDIGVERSNRKQLADELSVSLADAYVLYGLTQHVHWNATGPMFYSLHQLTETQYEDQAEAIDALAERIRSIGFAAPGGIHQMMAMTRLDEIPQANSAEDMIRLLIHGNETCARNFREAVKQAESADDVMTADLLTQRIGQHEENTWMLRALLS
jgi:starvation-inducible DNA-binding protein